MGPRVNPEFVYRGREACTVSVLQYARTGRWLRTRKRDAKARESFSSCISLGRSRGREKEGGGEREKGKEDLFVRSLIRMDIFYDREVGQLPLFLGYLIGRLSSWYRSPRNPSTLEWAENKRLENVVGSSPALLEK